MNNENSFRDWLERYPNHKYSEATINGYIGALKSAPEWFALEISSFLEIDSIEDLERVMRTVKSRPDYEKINKDHGHGRFSAAIGAFQKFLSARFDFTWTRFYSALADKLLLYKNKREQLIDCISQGFNKVDLKLPKLDRFGEPKDLDPFTVFGLFNKGITESKRIQICKMFSDIFAIEADVPSSFVGIPVLNNLAATFYRFDDKRGAGDIDNLWELFESAIDFSNSQNAPDRERFIKAFDLVRVQSGIQWNITMGLYWIRPFDYLNLDSRNRWFITNPKKPFRRFCSKSSEAGHSSERREVPGDMRELLDYLGRE